MYPWCPAKASPRPTALPHYDSATGLYYMQARYYDPATGQFMSLDPDVATTNSPFGYAGDDPVNVSDPTGDSTLPTQIPGLGGTDLGIVLGISGLFGTSTGTWDQTGFGGIQVSGGLLPPFCQRPKEQQLAEEIANNPLAQQLALLALVAATDGLGELADVLVGDAADAAAGSESGMAVSGGFAYTGLALSPRRPML